MLVHPVSAKIRRVQKRHMPELVGKRRQDALRHVAKSVRVEWKADAQGM